MLLGQTDSRFSHLSPELLEKLRIYQLVKITGWSESEIENSSASLCDWLLAIDKTFKEAQHEAQGDHNGG